MSISDLVPNLKPMVENLSVQFRFICFFVLTTSVIVRTGTGSKNISNLMRPILTAIFITAIIATLPFWFNLVRESFWAIAVSIRREMTGSVNGTGAALMQLIKPPEDGINWLDVGDSLMKAIQYALGWLIVWIGCLIQLPMMIVQFVMECMCYLFLPIAISLFAFESTKGLAMRYVQQTLAILAWPIGFAVVDLVGYSLLTSVTSAVSAGALAYGAATGFTPATLVIGGIVAIWLILGSLVTPVIMQMLFCSGSPLSSSVGHAIQMGLAAAGFSRMIGGKGGSPSAQPPKSGGSSENAPSVSAPAASPQSPAPRQQQTSVDLQPSAQFPSSTAQSHSSTPSETHQGVVQSQRGSVAVGRAADAITAQQAQMFANEDGKPFTQAFSNGTVVTYQPQSEQPTPTRSKLMSLLNPIPTSI